MRCPPMTLVLRAGLQWAVPLSRHQAPAIDVQRLPGDVACSGRQQEQHRPDNVIGLRKAAQRDGPEIGLGVKPQRLALRAVGDAAFSAWDAPTDFVFIRQVKTEMHPVTLQAMSSSSGHAAHSADDCKVLVAGAGLWVFVLPSSWLKEA